MADPVVDEAVHTSEAVDMSWDVAEMEEAAAEVRVEVDMKLLGRRHTVQPQGHDLAEARSGSQQVPSYPNLAFVFLKPDVVHGSETASVEDP